MGRKGLEHIRKNYNFNNYKEKWVNLMLDIYEKNGSWESRNDYSGIYFKKIA